MDEPMHKHQPIITSFSNPSCPNPGMDGFMRKPFALSTLLDTIEQLLPEQPKSEDENFEEMTKVIVDKGERGRR